MCLITSQGIAFYMKSQYEFEENTNMQSVCPVSWAAELLSVPARGTKEDRAPQVALLCLFLHTPLLSPKGTPFRLKKKPVLQEIWFSTYIQHCRLY